MRQTKPNSDTRALQPIDSRRWQAIPDPRDYGRRGGQVWIWPPYRCHLQIDPMSLHGESYIVYPYVVSVFDHHDNHVLSAVFEQTDYRELARLTKERVKDFTDKTKSWFSEVRAILYTAQERREYGMVEDVLSLENARDYLFALICDELDLEDAPVLRGDLKP